jgi:hypothetical protein
MYWDVIEVKPEADYRLFVRFKDGLAGNVRLQRENLTGALAPLQDVQFFGRVFIDDGAVAWPGEIDLAPDAMYAEVASRKNRAQQPDFQSELPRFHELKDLLNDPSHPAAYFQNFEDRLQNPICFQTLAQWEMELRGLDPSAWEFLKSKAARYLQRKDQKGRGWQQLFDALGEAFAYNYLKGSVGCSKVCFIAESDDRRPDLEGSLDSIRVLCEVKTLNNSDSEIAARLGPPVVRNIDNRLSKEFLGKLDKDVATANCQLQSFDPKGNAQHLVYIIICPDDWVPTYWEDYLQQIDEHLRNHPPGVKVVANVGPSEKWTRVVAFPR